MGHSWNTAGHPCQYLFKSSIHRGHPLSLTRSFIPAAKPVRYPLEYIPHIPHVWSLRPFQLRQLRKKYTLIWSWMWAWEGHVTFSRVFSGPSWDFWVRSWFCWVRAHVFFHCNFTEAFPIPFRSFQIPFTFFVWMNYAREFRGLCALPLGPLSSDVHRIPDWKRILLHSLLRVCWDMEFFLIKVHPQSRHQGLWNPSLHKRHYILFPEVKSIENALKASWNYSEISTKFSRNYLDSSVTWITSANNFPDFALDTGFPITSTFLTCCFQKGMRTTHM